MSDEMKRFIDLALNGEVLADEIDDFVEAWHLSDGVGELHEFLGMTAQEYSLWVANPDYLSLILSARHRNQALLEAVNDNYLHSKRDAVAAASNEKLAQLQSWVAQQG